MEKIINLVLENAFITISEMSQKIGITTNAIEKNISKLKKQGKLERVGSDKGGYWKVVSSPSI